MIVRQHKLARTTPAIRAEIAASDESIQTLAQRYGVSPMTVFKWKHRTSFEDRPHTPHRLPTTLTAASEKMPREPGVKNSTKQGQGHCLVISGVGFSGDMQCMRPSILRACAKFPARARNTLKGGKFA